MNILVATPGRLLQHMDETPGFECANVRLLVLDEADRCMDMGFSAPVDAIVRNLPQERQTLLFSATQSKRCAHSQAQLSADAPAPHPCWTGTCCKGWRPYTQRLVAC
jgi:ATP-dependent RNA helicase DDX10/DBP4